MQYVKTTLRDSTKPPHFFLKAIVLFYRFSQTVCWYECHYSYNTVLFTSLPRYKTRRPLVPTKICAKLIGFSNVHVQICPAKSYPRIPWHSSPFLFDLLRLNWLITTTNIHCLFIFLYLVVLLLFVENFTPMHLTSSVIHSLLQNMHLNIWKIGFYQS